MIDYADVSIFQVVCLFCFLISIRKPRIDIINLLIQSISRVINTFCIFWYKWWHILLVECCILWMTSATESASFQRRSSHRNFAWVVKRLSWTFIKVLNVRCVFARKKCRSSVFDNGRAVLKLVHMNYARHFLFIFCMKKKKLAIENVLSFYTIEMQFQSLFYVFLCSMKMYVGVNLNEIDPKIPNSLWKMSNASNSDEIPNEEIVHQHILFLAYLYSIDLNTFRSANIGREIKKLE